MISCLRKWSVLEQATNYTNCSAKEFVLKFFAESGDNLTTVKDSRTDVSRVVSRRDMATQMSPESSVHSSPKTRPSISASSSSAMHMFELGAVTSKLEIRDVQVDNQVTMTRWSKKHKGSFPWRDSLDDKRKKDADTVSRCSDLDIPHIGKSISKYVLPAHVTCI